MGVRDREIHTIPKELLERNVVPAENLEGIETINGGEGIQLVETRNNAPVFDVSKAADVKNEFGAASFRRQFETSTLDIAVSQSKSFAGLPQAKAGKHVFLERRLTTRK
jgi:hypothetical protein